MRQKQCRSKEDRFMEMVKITFSFIGVIADDLKGKDMTVGFQVYYRLGREAASPESRRIAHPALHSPSRVGY